VAVPDDDHLGQQLRRHQEGRQEIPPIGFNLAAARARLGVLVAILPLLAPRASLHRITRRDWIVLAALGVVGHCLYQLTFMLGLPRTSVANTSLIFSCTPIVVALMSATLGHERIPPTRWIGAALSAFGIYLVLGHAGRVSADSLIGDLWIVVATFCWAVYTVAATPLLTRHAPVTVTAILMAIGTLLYAPFGIADSRGSTGGCRPPPGPA
jgi:drug/metabolite transporter (DMT)-like permease